MAEYKIAVIRGDGIGIEVMEEGLKVLNAIADRYDIKWDFVEFPWGSDYYFKHGHMMPADALDTLAAFDQIYLAQSDTPTSKTTLRSMGFCCLSDVDSISTSVSDQVSSIPALIHRSRTKGLGILI